MKVVILCGGKGTRLREETEYRPKPMVPIGSRPILWHIMKIYSSYGFNQFVICLGYKGYIIKEYFANYFLHQSDVTIDLNNNSIETHQSEAELRCCTWPSCIELLGLPGQRLLQPLLPPSLPS